jgi:23S rRNA (guanosine2251-2'-O)-methyltransferase
VPVIEALTDQSLTVAQVYVATDIDKATARQIGSLASSRGVAVHHVGRDRVTRISGTGKQHQGVAADVVAPNRNSLEGWLAGLPPAAPAVCVVLDSITTPANVGMIIRSAVGAGLDGVVVPTRGVADLGPMVIKASAGTAFQAPLLRVLTSAEAAQLLLDARFDLVALDAQGDTDLWEAELGPRTAFFLGGEHAGLSEEVGHMVTRSVRVPLADGVESLNVAAAAAIVFFEARRRGALRGL